MTITGQVFRVAVVCLALFAGVATAQAHSFRPSGSNAGIPIPSIGHGEMAIIASHQRNIMNLALSALDTNEEFRRVLNFSQLQNTVCMWGVMPGSISDETSPFNECSHAYLAAVKMVLLQMRTMPAEAKRAEQLVSQIDEEMVLNGMALISCQFSAETFNSADVISPNWLDIPAHGPSVIASLGALLFASGCTWGGVRGLKKHARQSGT
ncbi:MAG: hypothetical protein KGI75_19455 [Rhizobiaceae bacterium]|nr:hypothetical protein [Rhizobiaceae bacterium]